MFTMIFAAALTPSPSVDFAIHYKECVEQFAWKNIRSGEPAESLVQAGESECRAKLDDVRGLVRQELWADPAVREATRTLSRHELEETVNSAVEARMQYIQTMTHGAALRNVVVLKSKLNELESN